MIQHHCTEALVHLSIDKKDFAHRIPVQKIGKAIQWNIGPKGPDGIIIRNVSRWTLRLFTQQFTDESYLDEFKAIVHEYAPKNNIDWKATTLAVQIQNEYTSRMEQQLWAQEKMSEGEIVSFLEAKYGLD